MTKWIHAEKMETTDGKPVPVGEVVLFTSSELHMFGDGYTAVGRLVAAPQDSEVVVEYLRFKRALEKTYRSPVMNRIRQEDYKELADRRMSTSLKNYDHDPSENVFVYCKSDKDVMRLWDYLKCLGERVPFEKLESVPEGHVFIEAQAPTYLQGELFAKSLEEKLK